MGRFGVNGLIGWVNSGFFTFNPTENPLQKKLFYIYNFYNFFLNFIFTIFMPMSLTRSGLSATLLKLTLLHECFSRFLNCTNGTKSRNAPHMSYY